MTLDYTLSLHDALPIFVNQEVFAAVADALERGESAALVTIVATTGSTPQRVGDRKSTRLNSSHQIISYAFFCLKKKTVVATSEVSSSPFPGTMSPTDDT